MKGRRLPDGCHKPVSVKPGDYWRGPLGPAHVSWYCRTPNGIQGTLRDQMEHEDGTITVVGMIWIEAPGARRWRGHLERGVWPERLK